MTDAHEKDAFANYTAMASEDYADPKSKNWSKKLDIKDWKKCADGEYKITVYQRKADKGVDFIRTDAILKGIPASAMCDYYMNPPPSDMLKEVEVLEKSDDGNTATIYWRFAMPMMSDRDNVAKIHQFKQEDGSYFGYCITVDHDKKPAVKNVVRMYQRIYFTAKDVDGDMHYTEISNFDMKGYMPARLMNMLISSETEKEFATMYKAMQLKHFKK